MLARFGFGYRENRSRASTSSANKPSSPASTDSPLQVCYRLNGNIELAELELPAVRGYADSRPVRYGNRAALFYIHRLRENKFIA